MLWLTDINEGFSTKQMWIHSKKNPNILKIISVCFDIWLKDSYLKNNDGPSKVILASQLIAIYIFYLTKFIDFYKKWTFIVFLCTFQQIIVSISDFLVREISIFSIMVILPCWHTILFHYGGGMGKVIVIIQ